MSTPREDAQRRHATGANLRASSASTWRRSEELVNEAVTLVSIFETVLLAHYNSVDEPRTSRKHDRDLADLRVRAASFGRQARAEACTPEEMLVALKSALAEAVPEVRVMNRESLSRQVTRFAIEGYYSV